jgi:hypothetical protein
MTSAHYYRLSPAQRWRKIRFERIELAGGICEVCFKDPATQCHHLSYVGKGWERLSDIRAVCSACHAKLHGYWEPANDNDQFALDLATEASK